jgi:hypothetical protein
VSTAWEHRLSKSRARWVARLLRLLSDRVFAGGDAFARENGWEITKTTGRFGFGARSYRDLRFGGRGGSPSGPGMRRGRPDERSG